MAHSNLAMTLSIRVPPEMRKELDELSDATGQTRSALAVQAIQAYLNTQAWQVDTIQCAVNKADHPMTRFIRHEDVSEWVNQWGEENGMEKQLTESSL